jgi:hypothetical protein
MALPLGVSAAGFNRAIRRFSDAVGASWVFEGEDAELYRDAYSPLWEEPEEKTAAGA